MRILQCLNWDLKEITKRIELFAQQGFDTIQITPVQPLKEETKDNWWLCYQPCGFSIGNQYGSKEDLINLCQTANTYKIRIIVDVVCTHMAQATEMKPHEKVDPKLVENPYFWREKKNLSGDWEYNDRYKVTHYCAGSLPGLNLYNWDLQDIIADFLNDCIACGVGGFRFDSGKSIPLPTDSFEGIHERDARPCDFFPRVLGKLKKEDLVNYIEVLNTSPDLILQYAAYGKVLTDVESESLPAQQIITFAESHDQYYNWRPGIMSPLTESKITEWYQAKVKYFPNTLYFSRPFSEEWKKEGIKTAHWESEPAKVLKKTG